MGRLFGTDGVRGVANFELTPDLVYKLGRAGATVLSKNNGHPVMIIGKDTRLSGDLLENALTAGILSIGGNVIKVGILPTPAIAYLTHYYKVDAGVVISASHNPFEYNGIKFFNREGYKLSEMVEGKIEDIVVRNIDTHPRIIGNKIGRCLLADDRAVDIYCDFLLSTIDIKLDGMKIALDCANGASYGIAPKIYRHLGAEVFEIADDPDGVNINNGVGSTHPEKLQEKVKETGADIGFAYDGDADRVIVVDEKGEIIDGDKTICICAKMLKDRGELEQNKVTVTVMSNLGLHKYINDVLGADVEVTKVGDRCVLESMLKTGSILGGEQSGHIIFREYSTTGDGILSSLQFMKALVSSGKRVSELADEIELYPQVLVNARVPNNLKKKVMQDKEILEAIKATEDKIANTGRLLIRPSGTEPLVRVMVEGKDTDKIQEYGEDLAALISRKFS